MATKVSGRFDPSAVATPANAITAARLLAAPAVVILVLHGSSWAATLVWVAVASTDFLDGWVARRQGATTSGAFLDPLADKVLVVGTLLALVGMGDASWVPVAVIAGREAVITGYRSLVARHGVSVPARRLAKLKTASQDVAVGLLLLPPLAPYHWVGQSVLWLAVGLAVVSGGQYLLDSRLAPPPPRVAGRGDAHVPNGRGGAHRPALDDLPPA